MAASLPAMPDEVSLEYIKSLPDSKSLQDLRQTCKQANKIIEAHELEILTAVVAREIGPELFPIAVACATAKHESSGLPSAIAAYKASPGDEAAIDKYETCAEAFCRTRLAGQATVLLQDPPTPELESELLLTLPMLDEMGDFHRTAATYVDGFTEKHKAKLPSPACHPTSPAERLRFFRAFYILELARLVAPFEWRKGHRDRAFDAFWRAWAPWEKTQVAGVFYYLCNLVSEKARETFDGKWITAYKVPAPNRFVIHAGLRNVHTLLRNRGDDADAAATQFHDLQWYDQDGEAQQYRWRVYPKNDNLWLLPPARNVRTSGASFNVPHIVEKYKVFGDGNDSGPRDAWFFDWLGWCAMKTEAGCWPAGRDRYDSWSEKLEALELRHTGYTAFFSREHLDALADADGQLLPSMEEMVEATREWCFRSSRYGYQVAQID